MFQGELGHGQLVDSQRFHNATRSINKLPQDDRTTTYRIRHRSFPSAPEHGDSVGTVPGNLCQLGTDEAAIAFEKKGSEESSRWRSGGGR